METHRPAPVAIKPGRRASFVRWHLTGRGWTYELVDATYLGRDRFTWLVSVQGQDTHLPRSDWELCAP